MFGFYKIDLKINYYIKVYYRMNTLEEIESNKLQVPNVFTL